MYLLINKNNQLSKSEALNELYKRCFMNRKVESISILKAINRVPVKSLYSSNTLSDVKTPMSDEFNENLINEGDFLISAGLPIRPCDLAALAIGGIKDVPVYKKPSVAFISGGSELIQNVSNLQIGQNIDANSILVKHMLIEMGAEPLYFPVVKNNSEDIKKTFEEALIQSEIVIINDRSSKGCEDFVTDLIKSKAEIFIDKIATGPGRPISLAIVDGKPVINLPGSVMAVYYGVDWCIRDIVNQYLGLPMIKRKKVNAFLAEDMPCPKNISYLCKINIMEKEEGKYTAFPTLLNKDSIGICLSTNAQFISEIGEGDYKKGDILDVELLCGQEYILPISEW